MNPNTNKCQYCGADAIDPTKWECGALLHDLGYGEIVVGQSDHCKLIQKTNEVARLRELLKKVLFELEKVPFQNPILTAFTAHRLADRYREQLNQLNQ